MAIPNEMSQDAVAARLDFLLQRARNVKPSTAIDPPLQVSELVPDDESLLGDIEGEKEMRWLAVDSSARSLFYAILVSLPLNPPRIQLICLGLYPNPGTRVCEHVESA